VASDQSLAATLKRSECSPALWDTARIPSKTFLFRECQQ
jgi:hypothetical protein